MTIGGTRTAMAKRNLYGRNDSSEEDDDDASFDTVLVPTGAGKKGLNALFKYSARDEDTLEIDYKRSDSASLMTSDTEGELADEVSLGNENLKHYTAADGIIVVHDSKPTPTIASSVRRKLRKSMRFVKKRASKLLDRKRHAKDDHGLVVETCVNHDAEGNPRTTD